MRDPHPVGDRRVEGLDPHHPGELAAFDDRGGIESRAADPVRGVLDLHVAVQPDRLRPHRVGYANAGIAAGLVVRQMDAVLKRNRL